MTENPQGWQNVIDRARLNYTEARLILIDAVAEACPGPHAPRQHRDARAPWCRSCRRTELGVSVSEKGGGASP